MDRSKSVLALAFAIVALSFLSLPSYGQEKAKIKKEGHIGSEACEGCHAEVYEAFKKNPHWEKECESCHGPGEKHAESEGKVKVFSFKDKNASIRSDACLPCHQRQKDLFQFRRGVHKLSAVGCNDCHQIHSLQVTKNLLKGNELDLCVSCHRDVKASFQLPNNHRVLQGAMKCSDCHTPHGTRTPASLRTWNKFNVDACFKCHPEKRGPWVHEHTAVKVEGCAVCHLPHGSPNKFLLTARDSRRVCIQCHGQPHPAGFNPRSCVTCHTQVHGSNFSNLFLQ